MLFPPEKHGAPVRHAFPTGKAWRTSAPRFLTHDAKRPWQNRVLTRPLFPCPICAQRRPRITKSSGLCSRARLGICQNAPRGFLPSHGLPPTMAAFRRKATQLQIQLRGKPRIPTGILLSARHATQQRTEGDTMYHIFIYYISLYRTLSTFFSRPTTKCAAAAGASPQAAAAWACYPRLRYFTSMIWISAS